jgi:methyl-accepting chemotaxis protein-1 (serine sensor receptor)
MKNVKISTRLFVLIGFFALLLTCIGINGLMGISSTNDSLKSVYEDNTVALAQLEEVSRLITRNRVLVMDTIINSTPENIEKRTAEFQQNDKSIESRWSEYFATKMEADEETFANEFKAQWPLYRQEGLLATSDAVKAGKRDAAIEIYQSKVSPLAGKVQTTLKKLLEVQVRVAKKQYDEAVTRYQTIRWVSILAIVLGVTLAGWFGLALTREISSAFALAIDVSSAVANGDLTHTVSVEGKDEIATLLRALGSMQQSLRDVVSSVRFGSDGVANASAEIAQGNQDLSARTEQQASSLEETAASMEELGSTVKHNAEAAHKANQLAASASTIAVRGGEVVAQVVETMKEINDSSRKISDIISVIDGIAFQTNILALNAAVEAARAGEQGRGFAVVASEVRSLAGRSADAAKEIKNLISASVERVEQGTTLVDQAGSTMHEVVTSIKQVTDIMSEISAASREQSAGVAQVGEAVTSLDQTTQQNAALVEEMAAAASSLSSQAQDLVHTVAVFKLDGNEAIVRTTVRSATPQVGSFKGGEHLSIGTRPSTKPKPAVKPFSAKPVSLPKTVATAAASSTSSRNDEWETF